MASEQERRHWAEAERLYVREGRTLQEIAGQLRAQDPDGPTVSTLSRWSAKGGWKESRERWREVTSDLPTRILEISRSRLSHLADHPEEAKADELLKLKGILEYLVISLAGPAGDSAQADKLSVWLEVMTDVTNDLRELEPQAVELINRHFDALTRRAKVRYA